MALIFESLKKIGILWMAAFGLLLCMGCESSSKDIFTIGIAAEDIPGVRRHLDGFKSGMAQMNFVEGQNVVYLHEAIPEEKSNDAQFIDSKLKKLISQDLDLLLVLGQEATVQAKVLTQETDLPVLFSGTAWPVKFGFVDSLSHPGGNMTGVRMANCMPKGLEWLVSITGAKRIYVPYNPDDDVSIESLKGFDETADKLGAELFLQEIHSVEEAAIAIKNLPEEIDAVYRIPSPTLDTRNSELSRAAIERRLPMCAPLQLDDAVLVTLGNDEHNMGEKLARLAQQIERGVKPSELSVETGDIYLTVNLNTAEKIGLTIPDEILAQANRIIR